MLKPLEERAYSGPVVLSVLLSAALVLVTAALLVVVAWQTTYSFLDATTAQRLESGEQAFTYFAERRAQELETLVRRVASDPSVVDYGASRATEAPILLDVAALGDADYIAVRAANSGTEVVPVALAPLVRGWERNLSRERHPGSGNSDLVASDGVLQWRASVPLPHGGEVMAGSLLGHGFSDQFKAWTGLEIALYTPNGLAGTSLRDDDGTPIPAPSFGPASAAVSSLSPVTATSFQFSAGQVPYRGRYFSLYNRAQQPVGIYLVALPASYTITDHLKVSLGMVPFLLGLLAIAVLSTILLAKRVTVPLDNLKGALSRIGEGDLDTPIPAENEDGALPLAAELEELRQKLYAALNQLAIEKSMYQGIFQSMGNAVFTTDALGCVTSFNPAAGALLCQGTLSDLGYHCWGSSTLLTPSGGSMCDLACVWFWLSGEAEPTVLRTQLRPDGIDPRDLEVTVAPIKDDGSRTVGLVHVVRDITPEQQLIRLKERFLMSVAHELRTPLSSLSASVELLQDDFLTLSADARTRLLATVRRGATRLGEMVSELMDLGSIQAGRFTVNAQAVTLLDTLQDAVSSTESLLQARGQRVAIKLADPCLSVFGDPARLVQILVNLISNAGKYGPEGDTIEVSVARATGGARIAVTDHGPGIGSEERQHVFEYYFRGANASRSSNGFGLGLAIIKGIVDAHGGEVGVDSQPGVSTTFWFTVPLAGSPVLAHGA